jgi:hypothetical protein
MGSGSTQSSSSAPGTLSPVNNLLLNLFGQPTKVAGGQFVASGPEAGTGGGVFGNAFNNLAGLLTPRPATALETQIAGGGGQEAGLAAAFGAQGLLGQGAAALPALLQTDPTASIAAARRSFTQDTLPAILEKAPGFSSSDLQRELLRSGTDLETNIAALKEANLGRVGQVVSGLPAFTQAYGGQLMDNLSNVLGFGQVGRQFLQDTSAAGDAFRTLSMIQSLFQPGALTSRAQGSSKSTGVL